MASFSPQKQHISKPGRGPLVDATCILIMEALQPPSFRELVTTRAGPDLTPGVIFEQTLHVCIVQKAPIHQSPFYRQIKILRTIFEKGHPRNIPVKLFQNLTSGFGEKVFLRISSCPYSAKSPHSPEPYL